MTNRECVTVNGKPLDRTIGTTDVHLRGVPVAQAERQVMASKRGEARVGRSWGPGIFSGYWSSVGVAWRERSRIVTA